MSLKIDGKIVLKTFNQITKTAQSIQSLVKLEFEKGTEVPAVIFQGSPKFELSDGYLLNLDSREVAKKLLNKLLV
ncbi:MAG: hypothetical protein NZO16_05080 [Deltaproteobacteria bacterium]|nr:hypothetical protein [Deltaproteobacteria bacterium]